MIQREGDRREEGPRQSEDHGVEIDQVDRLDDGVGAHVAKSVPDGSKHRGAGVLGGRRQGRQEERQSGRDAEGGGVDGVTGVETDARDQHAGYGRTDHDGRIEGDLVERIRGHQLVRLHERGYGRSTQGTGEAGETGRESGEQQEHHQVVVVDVRVDGQTGAGQSQDGRAHDHQHSFVDPVAHRAAPERADDQKGELDEARQTDPEAGVGLGVDLIRHGDDRQIAAE